MPNVDIERCRAEQRPALEAMFQLYVHDFSENWRGAERGELQENGRFEDYPHWDSYWTEPDRSPWLIRADGRLAGFALLNRYSHSGMPTDHDMAEFFVARKHRRSGVGRIAAGRLIGERPGLWELAIARANTGALSFWRGVSSQFSSSVDELDCDDQRWNGTILRFRVTEA